MSQPRLFDVEPDPKPAPLPTKRETRIAQWEAKANTVREILAPDASRLDDLRRAAAGFFHAAYKGKIFSRRPACKVTVPVVDPAVEADVVKLVIQPRIRAERSEGKPVYRIEADSIDLALIHGTVKKNKVQLCERIRIGFNYPSSPLVLLRCFPKTLEADAAAACRAAMRFLEDPVAVVARSGSHCVYCSRELTDPDSRARGIGPECFDKMGDFFNWIERAPEVSSD